MPKLTEAPPVSLIEAVTEILHGVAVKDQYRWLEEQESPRTREWLVSQALYARSYLDAIPGRDRIQRRIRELIDVETHDSIQKAGNKYFFRKRMPGQEQPCIFFREGPDGPDHLLIDPADRGTGKYTAVKPLRISPDGRLLLYEIKQGGERTGTFELLDIQRGEALPDALSRGYVRGFAFAPDSKSFYYVHEAVAGSRPHYRAAYHHVLGQGFADDQQIFFAGESDKLRLRIVILHLVDSTAHSVRAHQAGIEGFQQIRERVNICHSWIEPRVIIIAVESDRHSVVNSRGHCVGRCRQDAARPDPFCARALPAIPQCRECEQLTVIYLEAKRLLRRS